MGLSRTEIELLINARNNAQQAFTQLNDQVGKVTGSTQGANKELETFSGKTQGASVAAGAAGVAVGMLAERLARGLVGAFQSTIAEANKLDSGLIGLGATAKAFGTDAGAAQDAAKKLASDGLMTVGDASAGLKNLLAAGFGLPEATTLMLRFKDSAAFGRQGSLEFGQAIVGATEGIKNGNSALVDNAGVTKNLSNILVEAGFSAQDLSKAQSDVNVRQAIFNGILKETNPQLGQTALYLETAAGKQAQFNSQVTTAQQQIGKALQPALSSVLGLLTPLVQVVGDNSTAFVRLAGVVATVVIPLAALKAATALGVTPALIGMASATKELIGAMAAGGGIKTLGDFRAGIQLAGESAGLTAKSLGTLGTVAAVAAAAFIGWQIGRLIADLTGLDKKVQDVTARWMGYTAALKDQTAGAVQDVITRAVKNGAAANVTYAQAIEYNTRVTQIQIAQHDKSAAAQRLRIDAELALGRITTESANAQKTAMIAEEQAAAIRANRMKLTDVAAGAEKKYRDEIKATGYSQAELVAALKKDEAGFDAYVKAVQLSDTTVKRLKDSLKAGEDQQKKSTEATKKAAEEQKKFTKELEDSAGVISQASLLGKLAELQKMIDAAGKISTPALASAVRKLWPEYEELAAKAKESGLAVDQVTAAFNRNAVATDVIVKGTRSFAAIVQQLPMLTKSPNQELLDQTKRQMAATDQLTKAYQTLGITSPAELQKTAKAAADSYAIMVASGKASATDLKLAYQAMIDAQKAATGQLPGFWADQVFPNIKNTLTTLNTAVQGSFAQMLLGAKGFGEGFIDIWKSIKSSVLNILNSILSAFVGSFIKGLLGAMSGQEGAFSKAFKGMLGGGTEGGGIGSLLGLGGSGAAAAALPGTMIPLEALGIGGATAAGGGAAAGGGGAAAGGAAGGIGALGGILGGAASGGGGILLGMLGKKLFGGGGGKAAAFGAATGFGAGAAIGSVVPGLGTLIGGGIGALAGALSGWFGKGAGRKEVDTFANSADIGGYDQLQAKLVKLGAAGADLWVKLTQGVGKNDAKGARAVIEDVRTALDGYAKSQAEATAKTEADAVANADAVAASTARVTSINAQGDAVRSQLAGLTKELDALNASEAPEEVMGAVETITRARIAADQKVAEAKLKQIEAELAAELAAEKERRDAAQKPIVVPVVYEYPNGKPGSQNSEGEGGFTGTGGGGYGQPEGAAAGGVMANRPGLVIFGEGGETEVGGPASFFQRIFQTLGVGAGGVGGGQAPVSIGPFYISAMTADGVKDAVDTTLIPAIVDAFRRNVRGSMTDVQNLVKG